jgi:branched-chain amino acid transport system substrate-binding protein
VTQQLAAALPRAKLFGSAGIAESTYTQGIGRSLDGHLLITVATLAPSAYPPSGREFFKAYSRRYGTPQPYAIYGYEAMRLLLDSINRASAGGTKAVERSAVVEAIFKTRDRHSVLGSYGIDQDGDTTLKQYGVYRVAAGRLLFWKAIEG